MRQENEEIIEDIGLAISHLASDNEITKKSGKTFTTRCLAKEYNFDDFDGTLQSELLNEKNRGFLIPSWLKHMMNKLSLSHA